MATVIEVLASFKMDSECKWANIIIDIPHIRFPVVLPQGRSICVQSFMVGFSKKDISVGVKGSFDYAQDKAIVYDYKANNERQP